MAKIKDMTLEQKREYWKKANNKSRSKRLSLGICRDCSKETEIKRCPHCNEVLEIKSRCKACTKKLKKYSRSHGSTSTAQHDKKKTKTEIKE